jgi:hypothetical protein
MDTTRLQNGQISTPERCYEKPTRREEEHRTPINSLKPKLV